MPRATRSTHAQGAEDTQIAYDDVNKIVTATNALGKETKYHFTDYASGRKLTLVEGMPSASCLAADTTYTYDANGFRASETDRKGFVTNYTNNSRGLPETVVRAAGTAEERTETTTWHATFALPTHIVGPNLTIDLGYDVKGNLTSLTQTDTTTQSVPYSTNGQTRQWSYAYDTYGRLTSVDGPLEGTADTTAYAYNASGYLQTVTDAFGHVTEVTSRNGLGLPLTVVDANQNPTSFAYDGRGRLSSSTEGSGASAGTTTYAYNDAGLIAQIVRADGARLSYTYDAARRLTEVADGTGAKIVRTLDGLGNVTRFEVRASDATIVHTYTQTFDELGRLLKRIGAYAQEMVYAYDKNDNRTQATDPKGNVTQFAFDGLNRLIQETDALTHNSGLALDGADNLTSFTDPRSNATSYVYDGFGGVIRLDSPESGITDYVYDAAGNVARKTDARGVVTEYAHDALGRLTARTYPSAPAENVAFTYDDVNGGNAGIGRLTGIIDESGVTALVYDARGRVIEDRRTIGGIEYVTAYGYDGAGNVSSIAYPSGRIVDYVRDKQGRVSDVLTRRTAVSEPLSLASQIRYLPFGPIAAFRHGNGLVTALTYDEDYRLSRALTSDGTTTVRDVSLSYDAAGNVTGLADALDPTLSETFDYDPLHRLTAALGYYGAMTYSYDAAGNRLTRSVDNGGSMANDSLTYALDSNRLLAATVDDGFVPLASASYGYTANGNIAAQTPAAEGRDYGYNYANRLASVSLQHGSGSLISERVYNALGERVLKREHVDGQPPEQDEVTHYHYGRTGLLLAESGPTGALIREYVYLGALPIAVLEPGSDNTGTEAVVDNGGAGTAAVGSWQPATGGTGYEGANYATLNDGTASDGYHWQPDLPTGQYQVYAKWPVADANAVPAKVTYRVNHAGGTTELPLDQSVDGGRWNLLGTFPLTQGQSHGVELNGAAEPVPAPAVIVDNDAPGAVARQSGWEGRDNLDENLVSRLGDDRDIGCRAQG